MSASQTQLQEARSIRSQQPTAASRKSVLRGVKKEVMKKTVHRRPYRPHILRPSAIRRICHLPAEECNKTTEAKVMYLNSKFGKCSFAVCHEDLCPHTGTCKKHKIKGQPKPSIAVTNLKSRMTRNSLRRATAPKRKTKSFVKRATTDNDIKPPESDKPE